MTGGTSLLIGGLVSRQDAGRLGLKLYEVTLQGALYAAT